MTATNIHPTAIISPKSELGEGVRIDPYTIVEDHVQIGANTVIGPHVQIGKWTTIGEDCQVFFGATIGNPSKDLKYNGERSYVRIGNRNVLREYVSISRSTFEDGETVIGDDNLFMNWVNIAHDSIIGSRTIMANFATLAGHVTIEDDVRLGAYAALHQFVRVGKMAMAGGCSKIVQDVPPFALSAGQPARVRDLNRIGIRTSRINPLAKLSPETFAFLKKAFRILFRSGIPLRHAVSRVKEELPTDPEVEYLLQFIESSKRGIGFSQPNRSVKGDG
ncbi:MAG: acyl-ACP--UDP-N-acetylglucosamine O-acyltransferase [Candidatus Poribacteria bacterium]|nr:acyl-ACP--UDP-N-acetylglucosamine O-acyltransferase [Candidatus Poribacteria bacterium]